MDSIYANQGLCADVLTTAVNAWSSTPLPIPASLPRFLCQFLSHLQLITP